MITGSVRVMPALQREAEPSENSCHPRDCHLAKPPLSPVYGVAESRRRPVH